MDFYIKNAHNYTIADCVWKMYLLKGRLLFKCLNVWLNYCCKKHNGNDLNLWLIITSMPPTTQPWNWSLALVRHDLCCSVIHRTFLSKGEPVKHTDVVGQEEGTKQCQCTQLRTPRDHDKCSTGQWNDRQLFLRSVQSVNLKYWGLKKKKRLRKAEGEVGAWALLQPFCHPAYFCFFSQFLPHLTPNLLLQR